MKISEFPEQISNVLQGLVSEEETDSIWLIGSRANETNHADSDWDFIAFVYDQISERTARHDQIDIIRVDQNWNYLLEGQDMELSGLFKNWRWREVENGRAEYSVRVTPHCGGEYTFDIQDVRIDTLLGINVWRKHA